MNPAVAPSTRTDSRSGRSQVAMERAGVPELSLTRAVVQYWDRQRLDPSAGAHPDDIGVGLVTEGSYAASCAVLDLGSARIRELDLSGELSVLGWVRAETLAHVTDLRGAGAGDLASEPSVGAYCFGLGLRVLSQLGFTSLTRPAYLRIAFRDVARDLDPDSPSGIRVDLGTEGIARIRLDAEDVVLGIDVDRPRDPASLEVTFAKAFSSLPLRRVLRVGSRASRYEARLPTPASIAEVRALLRTVRSGVGRLMARFEPDRHHTTTQALETFGQRDTLLRFHPAADSMSPASNDGASSVRTLESPLAESATIH